MTIYGPSNPHPLSQMKTELVWEGKYDEFGNRREVNVAGLAMPLQKIETIDEPRSRAEEQGALFDTAKAHRDDFRNRLIWGDNKLVSASLLSEFKGSIQLIYIDPPFDIGADFSMRIPIGDEREQVEKQEALRGADDEHRTVVLKFFKAEPLTNTPSPLLHARKGSAFVHVDGIDSIFTRSEMKDVAQATSSAGGREVYILAWDFEMDIRQVTAAIEAETGVRLRLCRIPREIMEKNRVEVPPFFEMALLEAEPVVRKNGDARAVDIKLTNFLPSLSEVPSKELEALQERAIASGFDFIDFWAIDFDWAPGRPFNHHWQGFRTRKDRALKTVSDAEHVYPKSGRYTACIKVVDVFGCDTSITAEIEV